MVGHRVSSIYTNALYLFHCILCAICIKDIFLFHQIINSFLMEKSEVFRATADANLFEYKLY